ncbi:MAG: formyltransferase family protein [Cellulosilyticum sp.]|nr:formyltransferase family protein [Cellulosilyticum sp.]
MNIVYFGTDVFIDVFRYLNKVHHIMALYTYHNDEDYFTEYTIIREARESGIPIHYEQITQKHIRQYMNEKCELFFLAEYNRMLPVPKDIKNFKAMNTHSSLLPQGRSYYPIEEAMKKGMHETGVTMHSLTERLDGGKIILQKKIPILETDDSIDLYLKCGQLALEMVHELFEDFDSKWNNKKAQSQTLPYWKRVNEAELYITHQMTQKEAVRLFRCYNKMSKVRIGSKCYYISFLTAQPTLMINEVEWLSESRVLFKLIDGHMRIEVQEVYEGAKNERK